MDLVPDPDLLKISAEFRRTCLRMLAPEEWVSRVRDKGTPRHERVCGPVERLKEVKEG